ncbi:MAG: metallophosphoesterase [Mycoplasma sp.]
MSKHSTFIISDTHGLNNELFETINNCGFEFGNENHTLVLAGDIVDIHIPAEETDVLLSKIFDLLDKYDNFIYLIGNHEETIGERGISKFCERIKKLPVALTTENIFTCHGWYNPKWKIKEHQNKMDDSLDPILAFGDMLTGSPASIYIRQKLNTDFFGYKTFEEYENLLLEKYPNHKFIFGHYFNFFWDFEKIRGIHYFQFGDELKKFKNGEKSLLGDVINEYDYSKPYINKHKNIYGIDLYTKSYMLDLPYYLNVLRFESENKPVLIYKDEDKYLSEIIEENFK